MVKAASERSEEAVDGETLRNDGTPSAAVTKPNLTLNRKLVERRSYWSWNLRLGGISLTVLAVLIAAASASYVYHSATVSDSFLLRAEEAIEKDDFDGQLKWLRRYLMLKPDDVDAVVQLGIAADEAVSLADRRDRYRAVDRARKQLSSSIARLGEFEAVGPAVADLRARLIERLLQLGGSWFVEAERQTLLMRSKPDDAKTAKWMASALHGQFLSDSYKERRPYLETDDVGEWERVSHLPIGEVLGLAVARNPSDLDLIAPYLLRFASNPELFDRSDQSVARHQLKVDEAISELMSQDNSRAQLVLCSYALAKGEPDRANKILLDAAPNASKRLGEASSALMVSTNDGQLPSFVWDYRLLAEAAPAVEKTDPGLASAWYTQLLETKSDLIDIELREAVYTNAGRQQMLRNDKAKAFEIWERGFEELGSTCFELQGLIAVNRVYDEDDVGAADAVEVFKEAIGVSNESLSASQQWTAAQRALLAKKLAVAQWRLGVADGLLALRQQDNAKAMSLLNEALSSTVNAPNEERVRVASVLAGIAVQRGLWDNAAVALQTGLELDPGNEALRIRAAEAWTQAGNRSQARDLWRSLSRSESVLVRALSLKALFQYQVQEAPGERDFSGIRAMLKQIEKQLPSLDEAVGNEKREAAIESARKQLAIVRISLPPKGIDVEDHLSSPGTVDRLLSLSRLYPVDLGIQSLVAEQLAQAGKRDQADAILSGISELVGEDSSDLAVIHAKVEFRSGNPIAASERLESQAKVDPDRSSELLRSAGIFAKIAKDQERAYRLLATIPSDEKRELDLFDLAQIALGLPAESPLLTLNGQSVSAIDLSSYWEDQIRDQARDFSSYASWLEASKLIEELLRDSNEIGRMDPRLRKASRLVNQILKQRPRWGQAISLEGLILAVQKRHEEAVVKLRGGILAGDRSVRTRFFLVRQLLATGRDEEAETHFEGLSESTNGRFDQYGEMRMALTARRGDFEQVLDIARSGVADRPGDYLSHVVLARTAMSLAKQDPKKREQLLAEARQALQQANELIGKDDASIFVARIQLNLAESNTEGISLLQKEIAASSLDEHARSVLQSDCLAALREFGKAADMLIRADKLKPDSKTQVALANLYRQSRDSDAEANALWEAHRRDPSNANLRARLARLLAVRGGKDANWSDLSMLLAEDGTATLSNRLLHAILLGTNGEGPQREEAASILRELVSEENQISEDAARVLAALLRKQFQESNETEATILGKRYVSEIISLHTELSQRTEPLAADLYRFADFLLSLEGDSQLPKVKRLIEQLELASGGIFQALDIRVRYAERSGLQSSAVEVVENWVQNRSNPGSDPVFSTEMAAGVSLMNNGHAEEGLQWFEKAYRKNPEKMFGTYFLALSREKQFDRCIETCVEHYGEFKDAESVTLMAEAMMNVSGPMDDAAKKTFEDAVSRYENNAQLLESIATLQMLREDYDRAIPLFQKILKLDPFKIRSLNNLAMAYSQIPGQSALGLDAINSAIKFAGEVPELLDTKGTVLLNAGRLDEAFDLFQQLAVKSDEPRYQFHLVLTLLEQDKSLEAKRAWGNLDLEKLDPSGLTSAERQRLEQMKIDFAPTPKRS